MDCKRATNWNSCPTVAVRQKIKETFAAYVSGIQWIKQQFIKPCFHCFIPTLRNNLVTSYLFSLHTSTVHADTWMHINTLTTGKQKLKTPVWEVHLEVILFSFSPHRDGLSLIKRKCSKRLSTPLEAKT